MKILIADDHPIFRKGLADILASIIPDAQVSEAENGLAAERIFFSDRPDILILDINMPVQDGLKVCSTIKKASPQTKIIILTMYLNEDLFNFALDIGADGYIMKDNSAQDLLECIEVIMTGKPYVSSALNDFLQVRNANLSRGKSPLSVLHELTGTESRVLALVSKNYASKEIADRLFITEKSVENYRSRICKKLGIEGNKNSLLRWVFENKSVLDIFDWSRT